MSNFTCLQKDVFLNYTKNLVNAHLDDEHIHTAECISADVFKKTVELSK